MPEREYEPEYDADEAADRAERLCKYYDTEDDRTNDTEDE